MKILHYGFLALAALFVAVPARANVAAASGDLILAFRTQDGTVSGYNLEVDLGSFTQFTNLSAGTVLNLNPGGFYGPNSKGLAPADLATVYGAMWNSVSTLAWSVAGTEFPNLLATFSTTVIPQRKNTGAQGPASNTIVKIRSTIDGSANTYVNGSSTSNLVSSTSTALSTSLTGSYTFTIRGNSPTLDYGYFASSTESLVTSSGTSSLDLYELDAGTGDGIRLGTFALGSSGSFTFTSAPEPAAALLLGMGSLIGLLRRRRHKIGVVED